MGPGDHPFFKFGHNAIWIQDRKERTDKVYNFGTFRFDSPKLLPEFMRGPPHLLAVGVADPAHAGAAYEAENRTVEVQELDLDPAARLALRDRLDENALPEHRNYKYDYFLDNCSTRVRDAIDAATGGRLRTSAQGPARLTLRGQALRLTADYIPEYLGLYIVLGPSTDRAVDRWAEMFIPQELERGLRAVSLPGPDGQGTRPLVKAQQTMFHARRAPPLEEPPERAVTMLLVGIAVAIFFFVLGGLASGQPIARFFFGVDRVGLGAGRRFHRLFPAAGVGRHRSPGGLSQPEHPAVRAVRDRALRARLGRGVRHVRRDPQGAAGRRRRRGRCR